MAMKNVFLIMAFLMSAASVEAKLLTITPNAGASAAEVAAYVLLEAQLNTKLPDSDASTFLEGMANAGVIAGKGVEADYSSDFSAMMIGVGVGLGADLGGKSLSDALDNPDTIGGVGVKGGILVGVHGGLLPWKSFFGFLPMKRMKFFAHLLPIERKETEINLKSFSAGLNAQYKLIEPKKTPFGLLKWGGVDITTGLNYSSLDATYTQAYTETATSAGTTVSFNGTAVLAIEVSNFTIPVEISTSARILYILNLYGGLGMDLNFGSAELVASSVGNIPAATGTAGGAVSLNAGQDASTNLFGLRGFAGLDVDVSVAKLFVQYNTGFTPSTVGVTVGLRFYW